MRNIIHDCLKDKNNCVLILIVVLFSYHTIHQRDSQMTGVYILLRRRNLITKRLITSTVVLTDRGFLN